MLKNKIVVVTGGAGLLGAALCKKLVEEKAIIVIAEYNLYSADLLKNKLEYENVYSYKLDITNKKSLESLIAYVSNNIGEIDAVVNCAYPRNKKYGNHFFDVEYEDFCENVGMNLGGYFLASQQFAKYFKKVGHGNIINMASIYGIIAPRFEVYDGTSMTMPVEYAAIKAGILHLTKYIAKYLKGSNIRINTVSLGGLLDNQPESFQKAYRSFCLNKGMLIPEDVLGTIIYLLSDMSTYVNGQNIVVDDGFTL